MAKRRKECCGPAWVSFFSTCLALICYCLPLLRAAPHSYSLYQILGEIGFWWVGVWALALLAVTALACLAGSRGVAALCGLVLLGCFVLSLLALIRPRPLLVLSHTTPWAWLQLAGLILLPAGTLFHRLDDGFTARLRAWLGDLPS